MIIDHKLKWECLNVLEGELRKLPESTGVYIIKYDDKIHYIGSSKNLNKRLKAHTVLGNLILNNQTRYSLLIYYALVDESDYKYFEKLLVGLLQPIANNQFVDFSLIDLDKYRSMLSELKYIAKDNGRKQRYLAEKLMMYEPIFNQKFHGHIPFTQPELDILNSILKTNFRIPKLKTNFDFGLPFN